GVVLLVLRGDRIAQLVRHGAGHLDEVVRLVGGEKSVDGHGSSGVWSALPPLCSDGRLHDPDSTPGAGGGTRWWVARPGGLGQDEGSRETRANPTEPLEPGLLLAAYDVADASAAKFLCDRHVPDAVAYTIIDADVAGREITYGELRTRSGLVASALAAWGVGEGDRV